MANPFYQNALSVLQSLGQIKPGDNVRIQEYTAVDTYVAPTGTALSTQSFFSNSITKNFPYRNITFPDTSRSYVFQYAKALHNLNFAVPAGSSSGGNFLLESFQRFSTFQWVINGVQSPHFWLQDFMYSNFVSNVTSTAVVTSPFQAYQNWYELKDPINLAAGVNASFTFVPQTGLTTAFAANEVPYAPNTGVNTSVGNGTLTLELNGFQYAVIS